MADVDAHIIHACTYCEHACKCVKDVLRVSMDAHGIHTCMYPGHAEKGVKDVLHVSGVPSGPVGWIWWHAKRRLPRKAANAVRPLSVSWCTLSFAVLADANTATEPLHHDKVVHHEEENGCGPNGYSASTWEPNHCEPNIAHHRLNHVRPGRTARPLEPRRAQGGRTLSSRP